jgi:hypothetical protein|tara:strand:- start:158 stop:385 length:228 start_codon:yes stop_codon:yes gene_type:complete
MKNPHSYLRLVTVLGVFTLFLLKVYNLWYYLPFLILAIYLLYGESKKSNNKATFALTAIVTSLFVAVIMIFWFFL